VTPATGTTPSTIATTEEVYSPSSSPRRSLLLRLFLVPLYVVGYVLWCLWFLCFALFTVVFYYDVWLLVYTRALFRYTVGVKEESIRPLVLGRVLMALLLVGTFASLLWHVSHSSETSSSSSSSTPTSLPPTPSVKIETTTSWETALQTVQQRVNELSDQLAHFTTTSESFHTLTAQLRTLELNHTSELRTLAQVRATLSLSLPEFDHLSLYNMLRRVVLFEMCAGHYYNQRIVGLHSHTF
jgi:hypothetical protein